MADNLFGDLNGDGRADWQDDALGMWTLEMLRQQQLLAALAAAELERQRQSADAGPALSYPANDAGRPAGDARLGAALGLLFFAAVLCSLLGR